MKQIYLIIFFTLLLGGAEASLKKEAPKVYHFSMGSPKKWLPIARLLYQEISRYLPNTKFTIEHYPHARVLKDIQRQALDGDIAWKPPLPREYKSSLITTRTPLTTLTMTVVTNHPELFQGKSWEDLGHLKLAFLRGANYIPPALPLSAYNQVGYLEHGFKMLKLGRVDGLLTTEQNYKRVRKNDYPNLTTVKHLNYPLVLKPIFHRKHVKLRDQFEKALQEMRRDGAFERFYKKTGIRL